MTPLARIARLSAAFLGSNLARAAIGFSLSFALARGLGADRFGRWVLCTAWGSTLTVVVDLGFGVLLTRDGARDNAEPGALLAGALIVRLALAVPLAALMYASAGYISSDAQTAAGIRLAALLGTAGAAYGCFGALFRSQTRWLPMVLAVETGWLAIQLGAAWGIVTAWAGASGGERWAGPAFWSGLAGGVRASRGVGAPDDAVAALLRLAVLVQLAQIVTAVVGWRAVFGARGQVRLPSAGALLAIVRRALPFAASGIVANLQTRVGPLMLGYLSTAAELGLFAAASRFGAVARLAPQAVFAGALPVLSHEHVRDRASAERVFHLFDRMLLGASAIVAVGCGLFAAPALRLVYGPSFERAAPALFAVGIGLIPLLSNSGRKVFLYASGWETRVVRWSTIGVVVQAGLGAVLIPTLGGVGAAASLAGSEMLIWWPLRQSGPRPASLTAERTEPAEILST